MGYNLDNKTPGPCNPVHKLLPAEREAVLQMAGEEEYADLSHRTMAVTACDLGLYFMSFSSVYRIMLSEGLTSMRGKQRDHNGCSVPPIRKDITGPDQRWCWDVSYLLTYVKGIYLYLYVLLDEYSRKVIQWRVSWQQTAEMGQDLIENGFIDENLIDLPEKDRPEVINDRGPQMKAKKIKKMFNDLNMPQLFARPRTPNDNPFIESLFSSVKSAPQYPGRFLDLEEAIRYFDTYFEWYNKEHLHSGIDYVTPEQCHNGLRDDILASRKKALNNQRCFRKEVNKLQQHKFLTEYADYLNTNINPFGPCSVISP